MSIENRKSLINWNTVEVHYWFNDSSHLMDAYIQNKCEYELLGILKEISTTFKIKINVETEPFENGGLKRWFRITSHEKTSIKIAIVTALLTTIIVTPISTTITKFMEERIIKIFEDSEVKDLEKLKLKLEIEKLKQETGNNIQTLERNNIINKKKSNFYDLLDKYPKIDQVSFTLSDKNKNPLQHKTIDRGTFKDFILSSDKLEPEFYDDTIIEIISPVLKKGNYKWKGIYNGESISFRMKSKEFKELVLRGDVQFKNGTSINCSLTVHKIIDNEGLEKIINIDVHRVNHYFESERPIETQEGRTHRKKKELQNQQLSLFTNNN